MTSDVHFVQGGDEPILAGAGAGTLSCACGNTLVSGYDQQRVLGIGLQCARCGAVTVTPPLPAGITPPSATIVAELRADERVP